MRIKAREKERILARRCNPQPVAESFAAGTETTDAGFSFQ